MKTNELAAGTYRLICDIVNPEPDRRSKRDWTKLPIWKAGMVVTLNKYTALNISVAVHGEYGSVRSYEERFKLFDDKLEPLHETPELYASRLGYSGTAMRTLRRLIDDGTVTEEQVLAAMRREETDE